MFFLCDPCGLCVRRDRALAVQSVGAVVLWVEAQYLSDTYHRTFEPVQILEGCD